jgi:acyl-CoA reductase-like NAD-dependent aldehyde dehydrogenase
MDGSVVAERELANNAHVEHVLSRATAAQQQWRNIPLAERSALCEAMVAWLEAHVDDIAREISLQMGRPIRYTPNEILRGAQERARHMMGIAEENLADISVPHTDGFTKFIRREPVGTVLIVAPWNYPYLTAINSLVPALLAGNTIIMKHASQTLLCAERFSQACEAVGFPPGVFQHIHASHSHVEKMISDSRINFVVFTGSVNGGAAMERAAAGRFIGVGTELAAKIRHTSAPTPTWNWQLQKTLTARSSTVVSRAAELNAFMFINPFTEILWMALLTSLASMFLAIRWMPPPLLAPW